MASGLSSLARGLERFWKSQDVNDIKELLSIRHAISDSHTLGVNDKPISLDMGDHTAFLGSQIRSVWILAKPLSYALRIRPFAYSSKGKYHLNHWGVLVTHLPDNELRPILSSDSEQLSRNPETALGFLLELHQDENGMIIIDTTNPLLPKNLRDRPMVSASVVGETSRSNEEIETRGLLAQKFRD